MHALLCGARGRHKALDRAAFHDRGVVGIRHQHVLGMGLVRVADHAEHAAALRLPIDGELRVEYLVAAMFAIGLGKHHQLHIGGIALQAGERLDQVVDLIVGQRQSEAHIGV